MLQKASKIWKLKMCSDLVYHLDIMKSKLKTKIEFIEKQFSGNFKYLRNIMKI